MIILEGFKDAADKAFRDLGIQKRIFMPSTHMEMVHEICELNNIISAYVRMHVHFTDGTCLTVSAPVLRNVFIGMFVELMGISVNHDSVDRIRNAIGPMLNLVKHWN